jgi:hypothetical protein
MKWLICSSLLLLSNILLAQAPFQGGVASGAMSFTLAGVDTCIHFFGGDTSSGSSSDLYTNPYACDVYLGDSLSGYNDNPDLASTQNCIFYRGLDGSGYSEISYDNPTACPSFFASASGNDGYHARSYTEDAGSCYVVTLPIEASPLFAKTEENQGKLTWSTYAEINNQGFEIQKSFDGISWNVIGWVDGAGDHIGTLEYEFWDESLQYQNQYYRFKQIDFDESYAYSNVVHLHPSTTNSRPNHIAIYPNPVRSGNHLNIRSWISYELELKLQLYNTLGQLMLEETVSFDEYNSLFELSMGNIPQGNYFLILSNETGKVISKQKVVVHE